MLWIYLAATVIGVVRGVPTLLQAIDRRDPTPSRASFVASAALTFGVAGIVLGEFDVNPFTTLVASAALGLAAAAVHAEVLDAVVTRRGS